MAPDPTGPAITCPSAVTTPSPDDGPVSVSFPPATIEGGVAPVTLSCTATSGNAFPVGTTTVTCTATDSRARASACTFAITVRPVPALTVTRFVAFGDSLTEGVVSPPGVVMRSEAYPVKLQGLLAQRYTRQSVTVVNEGIAGEYACCDSATSPGGRRRLPDVLTRLHPDVLLLMEGTNDLLEPDGFTRGISALEQMVVEAKGRSALVFIATIPPQRSGGARNRGAVAAMIPRFNDEIRALATRQSVTMVDVYAAIQPDLQRLIGPDDLHLVPEGYTLVAQTFFDVIRARLEASTAALSYGR
jgi:lysophospholipase L1-like esterase